MKNNIIKFLSLALFMGVVYSASASDTVAQNAINGIVFDQNRKPVANIEVELLDDLERLIGSRKTRGGGFYNFQRLNQGIYYIRIRVGGTGFKEKKQRIDLGDLNSIGGVDIKQVDVHLEIDPRRRREGPVNNKVFFAQSVPEEAKKLYESGVVHLNKKSLKKAETELTEAVGLFPDYYDALIQLGTLYANQKRFEEAEKPLKRATNVNPKSFQALFGLAFAQHNLRKRTNALVNLKKALEIDSGSIKAQLLLGIVQRDARRFELAKVSLVKAKELSNNKSSDANWHLALLYFHDLKDSNAAIAELNSYLKNLSKTDKKKNRAKVAAVKKLIKQIRSKKS